MPGFLWVLLESLQQGHHFCLASLLRPANGIRLVDIPWFPEIYLPPRRNPPLDDVKTTIGSSPPERSLSRIVALVRFHPVILQHHLTNTGGVPVVTSEQEGSASEYVLHIDINVRMCQE